MMRSLYALLVALVLGGIVHITIVMLIPSYANKDAWAKLANTGAPWKFNIVAEPGSEKPGILPLVDPAFGIAACRFDLTKNPLLVTAGGNLPFWSVALFDRRGQNFYSFNDRTAIERQLFMIVVNPVQMAQLRKNPPEDLERAVLVQSALKQGFVLIRALQDTPGRRGEVDRFLRDAQCSPYEIPDIENTPAS